MPIKKRTNKQKLFGEPIGQCRVKPVTNPQILKGLADAMAAMPERIKKYSKDNTDIMDASQSEFANYYFE